MEVKGNDVLDKGELERIVKIAKENSNTFEIVKNVDKMIEKSGEPASSFPRPYRNRAAEIAYQPGSRYSLPTFKEVEYKIEPVILESNLVDEESLIQDEAIGESVELVVCNYVYGNDEPVDECGNHDVIYLSLAQPKIVIKPIDE